MVIPWLLIGAITWYGPGFYGQPLRCSPTHYVGKANHWIAADDEMFRRGWRCGDQIQVIFSDGKELSLTLLDSGYLHRHYIEDFGPKMRIVADLPVGAWPYHPALSTTGQIRNHTFARREFEKRVCQ